MKRYKLTILTLLISVLVFGQTDTIQKAEADNAEIQITEVDTTYYTVGKKKVEIIERNDSTLVKVWEGDNAEDFDEDSLFSDKDEDDSDWDWDFDWENKDKQRFKGHWAGFEFGMNNYVDADFSLSRTPENEFMDINTNRSWNFNFNFAQFSLPIHKKYFGVVTGLGIEWSNYHFSNAQTIYKNTNTQQIESVDLNVDLIKNRFQTTYLTVPVLLELQFFGGERKDRMYVSGGVIGGVKLGANTKYTYSDNGNKNKEKNKDDYYLRPFRYGFTGRVGYKLLKVYMNYYPTSLFLEGHGPELYPVAMGFCITF